MGEPLYHSNLLPHKHRKKMVLDPSRGLYKEKYEGLASAVMIAVAVGGGKRRQEKRTSEANPGSDRGSQT